MRRELPQYSFGEEIAHSVLHGLGGLASVVALVVMVTLAAVKGSSAHIVGTAIFGVTLVLLYTSSTLYHSLWNRRARHLLQVFDHSSIYLLIAGTYTPFALTVLAGRAGWILFGVVWGLAVLGIALRTIVPRVSDRVSLVLYLGMGWSVLAVLDELVASIDREGLTWLVAGGVAYTAGIPFYVMTRVPYFHAVWHVFVMAGSLLHVLAVLSAVIPGDYL